MKPVARMALLLVLIAAEPIAAQAQLFRRNKAANQVQGDAPTNPSFGSSASSSSTGNGQPAQAKPDPNVLQVGQATPDLTPVNELKTPKVDLPAEPVDPYMLTKDAGPFMVMAKTFRGPDAVKYAQMLTMELRQKHHLPAFVYYQKIHPRHSNIRGIPPTAPPEQEVGQLKGQEKYRLYDEAVVLVGNEKTIQGQQKLLHYVKSLHPVCIDGMPSPFPWRNGEGLRRALATTNPLVPAQKLYPANADPMILHMNSGQTSVYRCPGAYTLQVGYFTGRTTLDPNDRNFLRQETIDSSPLHGAADQADKLAEELAKTDDIRRAGYKVYTYHDRYKSVVTVGSFNSPNDPSADKLRALVNRLATEKLKQGKLDVAFGPQPDLMPVPRPPGTKYDMGKMD